MFKEIDLNKNGQLSAKEFRKVVNEVMGFVLTEGEVNTLFAH